MKYQYVIFDFDGTLFDSRLGIVDSLKYALDALNIDHPNEEVLTSFIGPPLGDSFDKHFKLSKNDKDFAIKMLRAFYEEKGHMQSKPYSGIKLLLEELLHRKHFLAIATAKPTVYAQRILTGNLWSSYFHAVRGSDLHGELFPKEKTIGQVLTDLQVLDKDKCVMIGDTIYDIKGAQAHGIDSIAVNYGYGKTQDIKDCKPTYFVEDVTTLRSALLG